MSGRVRNANMKPAGSNAIAACMRNRVATARLVAVFALIAPIWTVIPADSLAGAQQPATAAGAQTPAAQAPAAPSPERAGDSPATAAPSEQQQPTGGQPAQPDVKAAPAAPPVEPPQLDELLNPVKEATNAIEALEKIVDKVRTSDGGLSQQRAHVDSIIADADKAADAIRPRFDAAKAQLDQLGPGPKAGQPKESNEIAAERTRLTNIVTALEGAMKSTELVRVRARQLASHIQELRRGLFAANLFQRSSSPLMPGLWMDVAADSSRIWQQLESVFGTWRAIIQQRLPLFLAVMGAALLAYIILWSLTRRMIARLTPRAPEHQPTYPARATAASLTAPLYVLPVLAASTIIYLGITNLGLAYSRVEALLLDAYQAILTLTVVSGLASAILAPRKPAWRLIDLADPSAASLWRSIRMVALIYAIDMVMKEMIRILDLPLPYHVALAFVTTLAFALVLMRLVTTPFQPAATILADAPDVTASPDISIWHPRWLKLPLIIIAVAIIAAALAGYISLSRFAAGQVVITGSAVVLVMLLHLAIRTFEKMAVAPDSVLGSVLTHGLGLGETHRGLVGHAISAVLNVVLAVLALPALLLAWGFSFPDVFLGLKSALFGFEIGHFRISLFRLLMAVALFGALLFATRIIQRWLRSTFLRPDRMDAGIANSIYQGIGYVGFGIAALLSISFGGVDITNLAILAGALSVGIGFGLQSIVNNFVSGLILLVERPIKVGDWIVLKDGGQGYVRSISVRSTEIETFDRSSLIVPNSELISNVVTNWTHRNALGRVVIKIATSYKSNPERVLEILTQCAKDSPMVMQQPAPLITLENFGGDGLEYCMRVVVPDINRALGVQTDLRVRIFKAFQNHGIEFPTAERGIYLRDLDGLKGAVSRVLEERARASMHPVNDAETPKNGAK